MNVKQFHHANQFIIDVGAYIELQSYKSSVAIYSKISDMVMLYPDWKKSRTTKRHVYMFINEMLGTDIHSEEELKNLTKVIEKY